MKIQQDKYIPQLHFKPAYGWLNDPNGLMYVNQQWHLFYQYYPMDNVWGPMHWGHAVSDNLVDWQHLPIALAPDESGYMFSGSGIVDSLNVSGLFDEPSDNNLMVFYTSSLVSEEASHFQEQCLAYSQDGGIHWTKYANNPVIANPQLIDFRDPKVVWIEESQHWVLLVTHGQSIGFYSSTNLIDWQPVSQFGHDQGLHSKGPWECPDLFPLTCSEDGVTKWILVVGIGDGCYDLGSGTQYFIGDFDGTSFHNDNSAETILYLDHGRDYYATQSWSHAPQGERIGISWMSNWRYANHTETHSFRSIMTLPKRYRLDKNTQGNYIVAQEFAGDIPALFDEKQPLQNSLIPEKNVYRITGQVEVNNSTQALTLFGESQPTFELLKDDQTLIIYSQRAYFGVNEVMKKEFPHKYRIEHSLSPDTNKVDFELVVDNGTAELHLDQGRVSISNLNYPDNLQGKVEYSGQGWSELNIAYLTTDHTHAYQAVSKACTNPVGTDLDTTDSQRV
ncbi:glycoside hydrolase family 32 protein [Vibrio maritimus]|uniref:glycoside hydrolase family 32 protein n=1 Tax=Vibrio maritimus TaxID=990268 RepID=UPI003734C11D